jgi:hypothetical protein
MTFYKWLCDHCPLLYGSEPECALHERDMHQRHDVHTLEDICMRMHRAPNDHVQVDEYERLCNAMLVRVAEIKANADGVDAAIDNYGTGEREDVAMYKLPPIDASPADLKPPVDVCFNQAMVDECDLWPEDTIQRKPKKSILQNSFP